MSVRGAVDRQVVQDDRLVVGRQHDVDLDRGRSCGLRRFEGRQGILGVVQAVAAVAADMDTPGLAGEETERHVRWGSSLAARRFFPSPLTVFE